MSSSFGARRVTKRFAGVTVLRDVDFEIRTGSVHALLGENGSGKSTLIRVLAGVHPPSDGHVEVAAEAVRFSSPSDARKAGLAVVHQDLNLFPDLDVATNIALATGAPRHRLTRMVDRRRLRDQAKEVLSRLNLDFDPERPLRELGLAEWKLVEIARALLEDVRFLILDEPTALLDRRDSRTVLSTIERLRDDGIGIAFVSHRLDEAMRVADEFTVLRDGRSVLTAPREGMTTRRLVEHIVGDQRKALTAPPPMRASSDEIAVALKGVRLRDESKPFDLDVRRGEILGLTGLIGAGALELARGLGGRTSLAADSVMVGGAKVTLGNPARTISAGIGYVPEDRKEAGLVGSLPVDVNLCLASLGDVCDHGFVRRSRVRATAERYAGELTIRAPSLGAPVETLSGGNQQKVQIAKWIASGQAVLVIESPTHGVDVGAKAEIHRLLYEFTTAGGTVIAASTDIPDVLAVSDRIAVFSDGELVDVVSGDRSNHSELLLSGGGDHAALDEIEGLIAV